jgi:hypothetical protein
LIMMKPFGPQRLFKRKVAENDPLFASSETIKHV